MHKKNIIVAVLILAVFIIGGFAVTSENVIFNELMAPGSIWALLFFVSKRGTAEFLRSHSI